MATSTVVHKTTDVNKLTSSDQDSQAHKTEVLNLTRVRFHCPKNDLESHSNSNSGSTLNMLNAIDDNCLHCGHVIQAISQAARPI